MRCRYGNSGCVQYMFKYVQTPARKQAAMALRAGGDGAAVAMLAGAVMLMGVALSRSQTWAIGFREGQRRIIRGRTSLTSEIHRRTRVIPLLPLPRSTSFFSSGICFSTFHVRSSLVRQFSP